jgi:hypothetical protein
LSASSYLRWLGLALPVEPTIDQRAILDLVKINADLGRLGGLIKMWLISNAEDGGRIAARPKVVAMSREHHAIAIFSRAKASFTATERSLRS